MTGAQASYLKMLADEVQEPAAFEKGLSKREASRRIDALMERLEARRSAAAHRLGLPLRRSGRFAATSDCRLGARHWLAAMASSCLPFKTLLMADAGTAMALTLTSSAFKQGDKIPSRYTCEGDDVSPPLAFDDVPAGTKSSGASSSTILTRPTRRRRNASGCIGSSTICRPTAKGLPRMPARSGLPKGAVTGLNDCKQSRLSTVRVRRSDATAISTSSMRSTSCCRPKPLTKAELEAAMKGHVLAQAELMATYQKGDR